MTRSIEKGFFTTEDYMAAPRALPGIADTPDQVVAHFNALLRDYAEKNWAVVFGVIANGAPGYRWYGKPWAGKMGRTNATAYLADAREIPK